MTRTSIRLLAALALAAARLAAQAPVAFDVHVIKLTTPASALVPTVEMVASKRISADSALGERAFRVRIGGNWFGAEVHGDQGGAVSVQREAGNSFYEGDSTTLTLDLADPWRWGRRPRHGKQVRAALLCEPVVDPSAPLVALDARSFLRKLVDLLLTVPKPAPKPIPVQMQHFDLDEWLGPPSNAARILGSVPLREYLDPGQIERILDKGKLAPMIEGDRWWPLKRPLVVLAHRPTLEALARPPERNDHDLEFEAPEEFIRAPDVPRSIEDSVLIAYATATDPEIRGLAGWIASGTRSPDVYDQLIEDVRSGRAVLPGDEAHREALASHLLHARAWQSTTAPLLTLLGSVLVIAAAMLSLRALLRKAL
jgi:hypothetical protein